MFDVVIAGSGPAAAAALSGLNRKFSVLVLEPSVPTNEPQKVKHATSLSQALRGGFANSILGPQFEYLRSLRHPTLTHPKLRSQATSSVTSKGRRAEVFDEAGTKLTEVRSSSKQGGLSAVWGAQLYRYSQSELVDAGSWPISIVDIEKDYEALEATILNQGYQLSVGGDELSEFHTANSRLLLRRGKSKLSKLSVEPSRVAIKFRVTNDTVSSALNNLDFFRLHDRSVFTATRLMEHASIGRMVDFKYGMRVIGWREESNLVEVFCKDESGSVAKVLTKKLILACGTLETSALVLEHHDAAGVKLPFLDHPPYLIPVVSPETLISSAPSAFFPLQLSVRVKGAEENLNGTFYSPLGMLYSDLVTNIPFDLRLSLKIVAATLPMVGVIQAWPVSRDAKRNSFEIDEDGNIKICFASVPLPETLKQLTKALVRAGFLTSSKIVKSPVPGWGFHYVGTLPMAREPAEFQTHIDGRLWDSQNVLVVDGSVIPSLPALNHSLTLMANSRRIARGIEL